MDPLPPPIKLEPLKRPKKASWRQRWRRHKGPRALRDIRERAGISLETISERTRIPLHHLEQIERGDVSTLPPGIYAKSWAREYAEQIGVDPEVVLEAVAPVAEAEPTIDEIKQVREEQDRKVVQVEAALSPTTVMMRKFAAIAIVLTLLALAALYFWRGDSRPAEQPAQAPASIGTGGAPIPQSSR